VNIKGLIFDCDGTLADTMPMHWQAWQVINRRYQLEFPEDRFYALGGVPSRDILRLLAREQGLELDPLAVAREKEAEYLKLMARVNPIPEVTAIVRANHGRRPMAVASGGARHVIEMVLRRLELRDHFQAVVTCEDVVRQKPAPDIYLEAARRIGVPPGLCRVYEDSETGLAGARAAGMTVVDVRELRRLSSAA